MSLISPYIYGWEALEPTLIGCVATGQNALLLGKHGIGKSSIMTFLGRALSTDDNVRRVIRYAMDKENLISMVGIPDSEKMREGVLDYVKHDRSIFRANIALLDEITRAGKDSQNMVLEILEERTVFGLPLSELELIVASANDETYKAAMRVDDALLDRFAVVLNIPNTGDVNSRFGAEELEEIVQLNFGKRERNEKEADEALRKAIADIRASYEELMTRTDDQGETAIKNNVLEFTAKFFAQLLNNLTEINKDKKTDKHYISLRQISAQFPRLIMAIASYYKVVRDDPEYLKSGAWEAIKHAISTKHQLPVDKLQPIFENLKDLLTDGDALVGKVKIGITTGNVSNRIDTLRKYIDIVKEHLEVAETINAIGNILQDLDVDGDDRDANVDKVLELHDFLETNKIAEGCLWAAKMRVWKYACSPVNGILSSVVSWETA